MKGAPLITEKEWLTNQFDDVKKSIKELREILLGRHGEDGIAHRVHDIELDLVKMKAKSKYNTLKMYRIMAIMFVVGALLFIKESRDVLTKIFLGYILP